MFAKRIHQKDTSYCLHKSFHNICSAYATKLRCSLPSRRSLSLTSAKASGHFHARNIISPCLSTSVITAPLKQKQLSPSPHKEPFVTASWMQRKLSSSDTLKREHIFVTRSSFLLHSYFFLMIAVQILQATHTHTPRLEASSCLR